MNLRDDDDDDDDDSESMIFNVDAYWVYLVDQITLLHFRDGFHVSNLLRQYAFHNFNHSACSVNIDSLIISFISPTKLSHAEVSPRPPCFQNLMLCSIHCHRITLYLFSRFCLSAKFFVDKGFVNHHMLWPMNRWPPSNGKTGINVFMIQSQFLEFII